MVMNPSEESFGLMLEYNLEPEIYSIQLLISLARFLNGRAINIHLKLDTGMHRLGFVEDEIKKVIELLSSNPNIAVASIFSHLAGADEGTLDKFSIEQANYFQVMSTTITKTLNISPLRHLLNSSGILRFPDYQFEMVRLGIGLYGVDPTGLYRDKLQPVATLKTVISQIKKIAKGDTIGYGRRGIATEEKVIATLAIGYADGYSRAFGNGIGQVLIKGKRASVIGNVCMDMTMVDITAIDGVNEGDEAIVFGANMSIIELAGQIGTIPYEILTNTSERVRRVFYAESL